jgi:hypothetical protein
MKYFRSGVGGSAVHTTPKKLNRSLRGGAAALSGASLLAGRSNLLDNERDCFAKIARSDMNGAFLPKRNARSAVEILTRILIRIHVN